MVGDTRVYTVCVRRVYTISRVFGTLYTERIYTTEYAAVC